MSRQRERRIVTELLDVPHVKGRRVDVLTIHDYVEERGEDPRAVANSLDLDVADVYRALAYYYDHPAEMHDLQTDREHRDGNLRRRAEKHRPDGIDP